MATLLLEPVEEAARFEDGGDAGAWLVFRYVPAALFSLKSSRATSTAGKTLLLPTPYAVKMAFLDAALRNGLAGDPDGLVRWLAVANLRIGVPRHACVTGTIQSVRQEVREVERKRNPELPPYRASIAMREFVHYQGTVGLAFEVKTCAAELIPLLVRIAPAINYFGKRGSFIQYLGGGRQAELDASFGQAVDGGGADVPAAGLRTVLDDFGSQATFDALNSFSSAEVQRGVHRRFVETMVPLDVYNAGPGFVHYRAPGGML
jgi:hypothetical protein